MRPRTVFRAPLPGGETTVTVGLFADISSHLNPRIFGVKYLNSILVRLSPSTNYCDYVLNGTYVGRPSDAKWFIEILNPRILDLGEATMLGYGLIGTLVIICLVVWLVRAL